MLHSFFINIGFASLVPMIKVCQPVIALFICFQVSDALGQVKQFLGYRCLQILG